MPTFIKSLAEGVQVRCKNPNLVASRKFEDQWTIGSEWAGKSQASHVVLSASRPLMFLHCGSPDRCAQGCGGGALGPRTPGDLSTDTIICTRS